MNIDSIQSNFIILNLNYLHDHRSIAQLEELAKLKKENEACPGESNENITIISFFAESKQNIQHLIDKYKNEILFIPEANVYIKDHNLGYGYAFNYLLEGKKIKYVIPSIFKDAERLYSELRVLVY